MFGRHWILLTRLILVIIWDVGNAVSDPMFPHIAAIAIEEHVIYFLLIHYITVFLLFNEVDLVLLQLKLRLGTFFFRFSLSGA